MTCEPHEWVNPHFHARSAPDDGPMSEAEFDQLTAQVLARDEGKRWMAELMRRDGGLTFAVANWRVRIARMRERWRTGALTPG